MAVKDMIKTYEELITYPSFEERFRYLKIGGVIGEETFGFDRYMNQAFYKSKEWRTVRDHVIARDAGCDLGINGREIFGKILIHHINPITAKDIANKTELLLDSNYLICCSKRTHDAIHYGDESILFTGFVERKPGDTCLWK